MARVAACARYALSASMVLNDMMVSYVHFFLFGHLRPQSRQHDRSLTFHSDGCALCTSTPSSNICLASNTPTTCRYHHCTPLSQTKDVTACRWRRTSPSERSTPSSNQSAGAGKPKTVTMTWTLKTPHQHASGHSWTRQYHLATCFNRNQHILPVRTQTTWVVS
jgi:hypothetical protein